MKKHHFTEAQIQELQGNPYTKSVFPSTYREGGKSREIFVSLDYIPESIGG